MTKKKTDQRDWNFCRPRARLDEEQESRLGYFESHSFVSVAKMLSPTQGTPFDEDKTITGRNRLDLDEIDGMRSIGWNWLNGENGEYVKHRSDGISD